MGPSKYGRCCQVRALQVPGSGRQGEEEATGAAMEARGHSQGRPPEAGRDTEHSLPLSFRRELGPAHTLMSDFWSPGWEGQNKRLLF